MPEQAEIIRYIFDRFVKGQTANKIAQELNQMEKFTVNGKKWSASSILIVLRNEKTITKDFLTHRSSINKGEAPRYYVKNHHVGIIDRVTWDKVQTMLFEKPRADMTKGPGKKKVKSIKGSPFGNLRCGAILENGPDAGKPTSRGPPPRRVLEAAASCHLRGHSFAASRSPAGPLPVPPWLGMRGIP